MATFASFLLYPPPAPPPPHLLSSSSSSTVTNHRHQVHNPLCLSLPFLSSSPLRVTPTVNPRRIRIPSLPSSNSAASFDDFSSNQPPRPADQKSVLLDLIQEIEPLDVSLIQKDVPPTTLDAMKRTISGMLGLLPSDRFQVFIEALWEPLSKLLVSSMMTGYTLRNAEYRLCLERTLDIPEDILEKKVPDNSKLDMQEINLDNENRNQCPEENVNPDENSEISSDTVGIKGLGEISPEAKQYILHLQSRLSSVKKELHEVQRKSAALQMQQFVGEEKNDLLDYLRSLQPEKVAELSEPTSPELKETIHSVVHGLLATLSPRMHSQAPPQSENTQAGPLNIGGEDCAELVENTSLPFQPLISLSRDYLARLLFWCMLLGHYLRGLEYRMQLTELLSLTSDVENDTVGDEQVA
ncbi:hypothetical protein Tsubulata_013170 [Turnera subulata]|uniref:MAR-binding filament-like protein 1 n=1 Tax=Turnera subulata TaxID=218843 RepID=A0A9Q0FTK3_9ROSI|nr:hypothetical protein Tsubulata_013170 [Turnera subulata]